MAERNLIRSHVDTYIQQKPDHAWLLLPLNGKDGKDEFKNTVVYATFPSTLTRDDFGYYIDTTFGDISEEMRGKMKGLYITNRHTFQQEDIIFNYGDTDGKISASLLQVIAQKNASNELEVVVGVISLVRTPPIGWKFNNDYWRSDKDRVKRGLQYIFGTEAQKEISHK